MANEGRKEVWVSDQHYEQINNPTTMAQRPKGSGAFGCTLVEIQGPDGVSFECRGSCGLINRFLGRSCGKVSQTTGGGVQVSCTCGGGWWDSIWGG